MVGLKRFLLGGVAVLALLTSADAADVPTRSPVFTKVAPAWSWAGQYIGIHGGYAWASDDITSNLATTGEVSPSGGVIGFQLGYNYHLSPRWVVGYEIDASFGDLSARGAGAASPLVDINSFGTARARFGYANGPWLLYATGGVAWAFTDISLGAAFSLERPHVGYAVGAGVEYALSQNWSAKIEYLFADFGDARSTINGPQVDADLTMNIVRAGLNYRFANWAPAKSPGFVTKAPVAVAGWNGPYIGVHAGYGWGSLDSSPIAILDDARGAFGGIQSGYNWQLSRNWVVGLEGDTSWGSIDQSIGANNVEIDALGTARARLGYTTGNILFYATGGLAWARANSVAGIDRRDHFYIGWAAGAGVEYAFNSRWSAKVEYLYADFGTVNDINAGVARNASLEAQTVRVGLNYRAGIFDLLGMRW